MRKTVFLSLAAGLFLISCQSAQRLASPYQAKVSTDGPASAERILLTVWIVRHPLPNTIQQLEQITQYFSQNPKKFVAKDTFSIPVGYDTVFDNRNDLRTDPRHFANKLVEAGQPKSESSPDLVGLYLKGMLMERPTADRPKGRYQASFQYQRSVLNGWRRFHNLGDVPDIRHYAYPILSPIIKFNEHGRSPVVPVLVDKTKAIPCVYITLEHTELVHAKSR